MIRILTFILRCLPLSGHLEAWRTRRRVSVAIRVSASLNRRFSRLKTETMITDRQVAGVLSTLRLAFSTHDPDTITVLSAARHSLEQLENWQEATRYRDANPDHADLVIPTEAEGSDAKPSIPPHRS